MFELVAIICIVLITKAVLDKHKETKDTNGDN